MALLIALCANTRVQAQEEFGVQPGRPGTPTLPELKEKQPKSLGQPSPLELPPVPSPPGKILPPMTTPPAETPEPLPLPRVFVRQIRVTGSTVFSEAELAKVTTPYTNKALTAEDLEELRLDLTRLYVEHGYITSGAILPDQAVTEGRLTLHIIEGTLRHIEVAGTKWFREGYIRRRLALGAQPPMDINALRERLQFLQQDDRIARLNAELRPGVQRGESELVVQVEDLLPFSLALDFNNYQSPTNGAERLLATVAHQNLTGNGDILSFTYGRSEGLNPLIDALYTLPLTAWDLSVLLRYRRNETVVIEAPFRPLDIESESEIFTLALRVPLYRTLQREFALVVTGEHLRNQTFLDNDPFSFSPGAQNGEAIHTALRFSLEWTDRLSNQVIAVRSRFSLGIDALGATIAPEVTLADGTTRRGIIIQPDGTFLEAPDGRFLAWLGQFQWVRRFTSRDFQTLLRLDVQLADKPLLPLEQLAVGGRFSVRGYRENQLVRDNGLILSLEGRLPVVRNRPWANAIDLAPFVDFGHAWNNELPTPDPRTIASIGIGLRWVLTLATPIRWQSSFEVYWGYPLKKVDTAGGDLQDLGLHLQFVMATL